MDQRQLIARVLERDPVAERELYDAHVDRIFRLAYRMTGDDELAQEFTQETFIRAFDRDLLARAVRRSPSGRVSAGDHPAADRAAMTSLAGRTAGLSGLLLLLASTTSAQSLARQIADAPDGKVRMSFAAREGVCGNGRSMHMIAADRGRSMWIGRSDDWEATCDPGPVRVVLRVRGGEVRDIDAYVGGRWRTGGERVTDLGTVPALEAAQYLIGLAERRGGGVGEDAILPPMLAEGALADSDDWGCARLVF